MGDGAVDEPNQALTHYLDLLGWGPKKLASRINKVFGPGTVSPSAPFPWRDRGAVPHPPLPTMTAYVLSEAIGHHITVEELWQGRAANSPLLVPADDGIGVPWTSSGTVQLLQDWLLGGLMDRREFLAISGTALTSVAGHYLSLPPRRRLSAPQTEATGDTLIERIEASIPPLRDADHRRGGLDGLTYVRAQFLAVAALVHQCQHSTATNARLLTALGELGDLAGYMAFDSGRHGIAQRFWLTALHAAHDAGDRPLAASILSNLSYQASHRGHGREALDLGEAAQQAAKGASAAVRAAVTSRLATAYAAAGQRAEFARAHDQAQDLLTASRPGNAPQWADFATPRYLQTQAAYALIGLGRMKVTSGDRVAGRRLLSQGEEILAPDITASNDAYRRSDVLRGTWLALAYTAHGELEHACATGRIALQRLNTVASARCIELLQELQNDLSNGRHANRAVREFRPELAEALSRPQLAWTV